MKPPSRAKVAADGVNASVRRYTALRRAVLVIVLALATAPLPMVAWVGANVVGDRLGYAEYEHHDWASIPESPLEKCMRGLRTRATSPAAPIAPELQTACTHDIAMPFGSNPDTLTAAQARENLLAIRAGTRVATSITAWRAEYLGVPSNRFNERLRWWNRAALAASGVLTFVLPTLVALLVLHRTRRVPVHLDARTVTIGYITVPLPLVTGARSTAGRRLIIDTNDGELVSEPFAEADDTLHWLVQQIELVAVTPDEAEAHLRAEPELRRAAASLQHGVRER